MVDPVENMQEAEPHEPPDRLPPARVERQRTRIVAELIGPDRAAAGHELQGRDDSRTEVVEPRPQREGGLIRADRILEKHVEEHLIPYQVLVVRWERFANPLEGRCEVGERIVGRKRDLRGQGWGRGQRRPVLADDDERRDPLRGDVSELRGKPFDI